MYSKFIMTIKLKSIIKQDVQSNEPQPISSTVQETLHIRELKRTRDSDFSSFFFSFVCFLSLTAAPLLPNFISALNSFSTIKDFVIIFTPLIFLTMCAFLFKGLMHSNKQLKSNLKKYSLDHKTITRKELLIHSLGDTYINNKVACDNFISSLDTKTMDTKEIVQRKNLLSEQDVKDIESINSYIKFLNTNDTIKHRTI